MLSLEDVILPVMKNIEYTDTMEQAMGDDLIPVQSGSVDFKTSISEEETFMEYDVIEVSWDECRSCYNRMPFPHSVREMQVRERLQL